MKKVYQALLKALHFGQLESLSHTQNRKIFNVNFASLIAVSSSSLYSLNLLIIVGYEVALINFMAAVPFFFLYLSSLWLNHKQRYLTASWMMSLSITSSVAVSIWVISGDYFNLHYYFILFAIAPLLFFNNKDWNKLLILYFINIGLFIKVEYFGIEPWLKIDQDFENDLIIYLQASNLGVSLLTLWFVTFLSERSAQINEERLEKLLAESQDLQNQIIESKEIAETANKAKSIFLANMSHEIRTPLNGVIGFTDLLRNTQLTPIQHEYISNANTSGHILLGIINDILDFSKIEAGEMNVELVRTDIIEILESSIDIVKYQAEKKNIELLLNIDPSLPNYAITDSLRIKQIMANLLGNAVKFTEKGEVELKVCYKELDSGKGKISFSVRDTGIGISEDQQLKLFKAFSQADSSTTRKFGGTGLGLIISDLIAQKLGSKIYVNSKKGEGSTFYFDMLVSTEAGDSGKLDNTNQFQSCLIIDDNSTNCKILEQMMKEWGIVSVSCHSGSEALNLLQNPNQFDLIICDYSMPNMNGLEMIRKIRKELNLTSENKSIALMHSFLNDLDTEKIFDELEICFHITKPIKRYELYFGLSQACDKIKNQNKQNLTPEFEKEITEFRNIQPRIMIAEDVDLNMLMVKAMLRKIAPNAELIEAKNGIQVLEHYSEKNIDLILMDVQMPEMDGLEATKKIRELEIISGKHVPIVALTAGAFKEEQDKCHIAGMDYFLTKPIETEKIKSILMKVLL